MSDKSTLPKGALPELLCPVGSPAALKAAISGGADAVYMGGASFHARMYAHSFSGADLADSISLAHAYGVKVYITLNTLVLDLELDSWLRAAQEAYLAGADALIVDDVGAVAQLHNILPDFPLHASTQMSVHHSFAGPMLQKMGYSRMVVARETSLQDLKTICKSSPLEIETFVHGALCVCHSGQCLFSSLVGGRSGNRGTCAQPCRLPYTVNGKPAYPLSLKDLSLAAHIPELLETGVSSLKIEGRMKSPEYVYTTAKIWRTLLDNRRSATPDEIQDMQDAFSRDGFTDAYFTRRVYTDLSHKMLGTRTQENKTASKRAYPVPESLPKIPLQLSFSMKSGKPVRLTLATHSGKPVSVQGAVPDKALSRPMSEEQVIRQLTKFGGTPYEAVSVTADLDPGLIISLSSLNALRRDAVSLLLQQADLGRETALDLSSFKTPSLSGPVSGRSAFFYSPEQVTPRAKRFFDCQYLPVWNYHGETNGVALPPVIFDSESAEIRSLLEKAVQLGAKHVLMENPWHYPLIEGLGLTPHADFRFNVTNRNSLAFWKSFGYEDIILSAELNLPQCRDLMPYARVITYGRIPLMILEKCVGREIGTCDTCKANLLRLTDRTGTEFPVLREWSHRSIVWNGQPVWAADWRSNLKTAHIQAEHFIFSIEQPSEVDTVISSYEHGVPLASPFRRIGVANLKKSEPDPS